MQKNKIRMYQVLSQTASDTKTRYQWTRELTHYKTLMSNIVFFFNLQEVDNLMTNVLEGLDKFCPEGGFPKVSNL